MANWLLVNSLLLAPHFSETIKVGLGIESLELHVGLGLVIDHE